MVEGYHPGEYNFPRNDQQRLEICIGAILTQNTRWRNVNLALRELKHQGLFSLCEMQKAEPGKIALAIQSAGYYNQKSQTIKRLVKLLNDRPFEALEGEPLTHLRKMLLEVKGIGPETADCILLYALNRSSFVVDAYTRRILDRHGILPAVASYDGIKQLFENALENRWQLFQEYHALLVIHGKQYYGKTPYGELDPLLNRQSEQRGDR